MTREKKENPNITAYTPYQDHIHTSLFLYRRMVESSSGLDSSREKRMLRKSPLSKSPSDFIALFTFGLLPYLPMLTQ